LNKIMRFLLLRIALGKSTKLWGGQAGETSFGKGHDFSRAKNRERVAASAAVVGFGLKPTPAAKQGTQASQWHE
jgi:hypothetical protein